VTRNLLEIALLFLVFYLPGYLWPGLQLDYGAANLGPYMLQFLTIAPPQILLLLYILNLRAESAGGNTQLRLAEFGLRRPRSTDLLYALAIFGGIVALLLLLGLILSLLPAAGRSMFTRGFRWKLEEPRLIPLVLLFCLVTGYREELFFRSYLITRFSQLGLPAAAGVGLSTMLFSVGHLYQGVAGLAVAVIQGLYFAILFVRLRNLHPLALAHGLYNAAALLVTLFVDAGLPVQP
jgi:hypothetical protein